MSIGYETIQFTIVFILDTVAYKAANDTFFQPWFLCNPNANNTTIYITICMHEESQRTRIGQQDLQKSYGGAWEYALLSS